MSYDHWKTTDRDRENEWPREDVGTYPGMRPMSEAPRDGYTHPIIGILRDTEEGEDPRREVFFSESPWGGDGRWFDVNGDGAPDGRWDRWDTEDFIGWLPVPEPKPWKAAP